MADTLTLAVDIGGTGLKLALLDEKGEMVGKRVRTPTPPKPVSPIRVHAQAIFPSGTVATQAAASRPGRRSAYCAAACWSTSSMASVAGDR